MNKQTNKSLEIEILIYSHEAPYTTHSRHCEALQMPHTCKTLSFRFDLINKEIFGKE